MFSRGFVASVLMLLFGVFAHSQGLSGEGRLPTFKELLKREGIQLSPRGLRDALRSGKPEVRYLAAQELAEQKMTEATPAIAAALRVETNLRARTNIAYALAQLGDKEGFAALKAVCQNRSLPFYESMLAMEYLLTLKDESCSKVVLDTLRPDADASARVGAMYLLRRMRDITGEERQRALNFLHDSLFDQDTSVKLIASDTLVWINDETAIPALQRAIASEPNKEVSSKMQADLKRLVRKRDVRD